jgi:hypothetical protein
MLTTLTHREVQTAGVAQTQAFTIKANAKAFKILIDGLYSDKVKAVVRELWTNAWDAHAMAGNNDPFICQLPTPFDPVFRVRDFGVGMSHEQIMHLYTTVFESSKEDTNTQVGKLGLGSKSPFAYTDTFTVTAWDDSEKRSYSAYIGSDHIPTLAYMGAEASDEPRGIEISFPVKADDCGDFVTAVRSVILGFDVMPIIEGVNLGITPMKTILSGPGWKLVEGAPWGTRAHARQGCVIYPLDRHAIKGITTTGEALLNSALFIDFEIGQLEISASRESLGYDEPTVANIKVKLAAIEQQILEEVQKAAEGCKTMREAATKVRMACSKSVAPYLYESIKARTTWRGREIRFSTNLNPLLERYKDNYDKGGMRIMSLTQSELAKGRTGGRRTSLKWEPSSYITLHADDQRVILWDDPEHPASLAPHRIRLWADTKNQHQGVLWVKANKNSIAFRRLLAELGRPEVIALADLDKPARGYSYSNRTKVRVKKLFSGSWHEIDVNPGEEFFYVEMKRNKIERDGKTHMSTSEVSNTAKALIAMGYMDKDAIIVAVPASLKALIKRNEETWTDLWEVARKAFEEHYDETKSAEMDYLHSWLNESHRDDDLDVLLRKMIKEGITFGHVGQPADMLMQFWKDQRVVIDRPSNLTLRHAEILGRNLGLVNKPMFPVPTKIEKKRQRLEAAFSAAYPLLEKNIQRYDVNQKMIEMTLTYVNLVDDAELRRQSVSVDDAAEAA